MGKGKRRWSLVAATAGERAEAARIQRMQDPEEVVGRLGSPPPDDLIELHKNDPARVAMVWEPRVIMLVTERLAEMDTSGSRAALAELTRGPSGVTKRWAVKALAEKPHEESVDDFKGVLDDGDADTRAWAAQALGVLEYPDAIPRIVPMLESRSSSEKVCDARALAQIGSEEGIQAVRRARRKEWRLWIRVQLPPV